jgi:pimeloyl-ACP methyl ester carboxylesterase
VAKVLANGIEHHVQRVAPVPGITPGPTVVFIHGISTDSLASYYFTLAQPFADAGLPVVMYDLRGHGRSDRPSQGYTLTHFVADLSALLDVLGVGAPVYLIGNSFGGTVAFSYAVAHPDRVAGVAVIESEPATGEWAAKMAANFMRASTQLMRREALSWIAVRYGRHTARLAKAAGDMLQATTVAEDLPASPVLSTTEISSIRCPVLAIYGDRSDLAVQAPLMESMLPACVTAIIPGQEHSVLIEVPQTVKELILSWMATHDPARASACTDRREVGA